MKRAPCVGDRAHPRGFVAFDNAGTLSSLVVDEASVSDAPTVEKAVPAAQDRALVLVNIACGRFEAFETDEPIGRVLDREGIGVRSVLSSPAAGEVSPDRVRRAVLADRTTPAEAVATQVAAVHQRARMDGPGPAVAVQLVVDLVAERVCTIIGYAPVPRPDAPAAIERVRAAGWVPCLVSGDTAHVLDGVAEAVGIDLHRVHADCTVQAKGDRIAAYQAETDGPVVMIGDYVNDRKAFVTADYAILVAERPLEGALSSLADVVDAVVPDLAGALNALADHYSTFATLDAE